MDTKDNQSSDEDAMETQHQLKAQTDRGLLQEARRLTKTELQIKPDHLHILVPYIVTRANLHSKKHFVKRHLPKTQKLISLWEIQGGPNLLEVLHETAEDLKNITESAGSHVALIKTNDLFICSKSLREMEGRRYTWKIVEDSTIAAYVAKEKMPLVIKNVDCEVDKRFPDGQDLGNFYATNILAFPVEKSGFCVAVLELYKTNGVPYTGQDYNTASLLLSFASDTIIRNREMVIRRKYEETNDILLTEMMRGMSEDVHEANAFANYIINFLKLILDAESVTYFTFNEGETCERKYTTDDNPVAKLDVKRKKIRFEKEKRIATIVNETQKTINFTDIFNDSRFDKSVDRHIGLFIRSALGTEISITHDNHGVILAINKLSNDIFTNIDEKLMKTVSKYLMISLAYQNSYMDFKWREQFNIALMQLGKYQIQRRVSYPESYSLDENIYIPPGFYSFNFVPDDPDGRETIKYVFHIFQIVGGYFPNKDKLYKFLFAVKKIHRENPYHNFNKAFLSLHFMYLLIYYHPEQFPASMERMALLMACFLYRSDHRGLSAKYLNKVHHPIMNHPYPETMEIYHYFAAKYVLNCTKIVDDIKSDKLPVFHRIFKECILASSLKVYLKRRIDLKVTLRTETFDWTSPRHQSNVRMLIMSACDFIAFDKNEEHSRETVYNLFAELFAEGDLLRAMGNPIPIMLDRTKSYLIPSHQVNFLQNLILPCFEMLKELFPKTENLVHSTNEMIHMWQSSNQGENETYEEDEVTLEEFYADLE